jgi:Protein chain release factor B
VSDNLTEDVTGINAGGLLTIPRAELEFRTSRSSGAGGQHVNKTSSRVEISWNILRSIALTDEQRELLMKRLGARVSEEGAVRVVAVTRGASFAIDKRPSSGWETSLPSHSPCRRKESRPENRARRTKHV